MEILVCIKQVPDTTEIKIDPVTNTLIRDGVPSIVNTFDAYALELAVQFKEKFANDAKITVLSMGPEQAKVALKECLLVPMKLIWSAAVSSAVPTPWLPATSCLVPSKRFAK